MFLFMPSKTIKAFLTRQTFKMLMQMRTRCKRHQFPSCRPWRQLIQSRRSLSHQTRSLGRTKCRTCSRAHERKCSALHTMTGQSSPLKSLLLGHVIVCKRKNRRAEIRVTSISESLMLPLQITTVAIWEMAR